MQPIDDYLAQSLTLGEKEFVSTIPAGVLLCEPDAPDVDPRALPAADTRCGVDADTENVPPWMRGARTPGNEVYFVLPLPKRPGLPYPDRFLVGRTDRNDLVIPHLSVSRAHAYLTCDGNGVHVVDVGSKHGTFLGDERLAPNQPHALGSGRRVGFGHVRTMYLSAARFFQYCQARTVADHAERTMGGAIAYKP